jgi:large repetitive protein
MSIFGHNRRFTPVAVKLRQLATIIGAALLAGSAGVAALTAAPATPASADTAPYTAACTSGFLGSFTAASIATTGTLSASPVAPGGSETLNNYGLAITIPASVVNAAIANGVTSLTGSVATSIDATNITPASTPETLTASTGPLTADTPLTVTTVPLGTAPSFTGAAAAGVVHLTQDANITLTFDAQVAGITLPVAVDVSCTANPADIDTAAIVSPVPPQITSRPADTVPAGSAFSYTITSTGTPTPALSLAAGSVLPAGAAFTGNGDGTATLAGSASVAPGVYTFAVDAENGVTPDAAQAFTLTVAAPGSPVITSAPGTTVTAGTAMAPFIVTTTGFPIPSLTRKGALPSGITFTSNADGTATISGNPKATQDGTYVVTITAANDQGTVTQTFTLSVNQAPAINSRASTTFTAGDSGTFTVTTRGFPAPSLTETGPLPAGVTFTDNGDGTATISGIPASGGSYPILLTAASTAGTVSQWLTVAVDQPAVITSAPGITTTAGTAMTPFTVTTAGFPVPSLTKTGALPSGVTFDDNGNGTATISGVPKATQGGTYVVTITARNGQGTVTQTFTVILNEAPTITSHASTTFTAGDSGTFTVTTRGFPAPSLTETGPLPAGVTFTDNGDGTATISGIPASGGSYPILITATNAFGDASQSLTVKVN